IPPGKPVEIGYSESFNGRLRDECLNGEVFFSLVDARRVGTVAARLQRNTASQRSRGPHARGIRGSCGPALDRRANLRSEPEMRAKGYSKGRRLIETVHERL